MIDRETSKQSLLLLGTAIGELMEDTADVALSAGVQEPVALAAILQAVGADIAALAAAFEVLVRRAEP